MASPIHGLLKDEQGKMVEKAVVVAVVVVLVQGGLWALSESKQSNFECVGEQIQNLDGTVTCGKAGGATGPPAPVATLAEAPRCRGGVCMCFVAGTPVVTALGLVPIEAIRPGTLVLARNDQGGELHWKPVLATAVSHARSLVRLSILDQDGRAQIIETTRNHPFFVDGQGWVEAGELTPGEDNVTDTQGHPLPIVAAVSVPEQATVYNFEVADDHTYFVGDPGVWVHNARVSVRGRRRPRPAPVVGGEVPVVLPAVSGAEGYSGDGRITQIHADGTFDVRVIGPEGTLVDARSDGRGGFTRYWNVGERTSVRFSDGEKLDLLIIGRNPDGSADFVSNSNGQRLTGTLGHGRPPQIIGDLTATEPGSAPSPVVPGGWDLIRRPEFNLATPDGRVALDDAAQVSSFVQSHAQQGHTMAIDAVSALRDEVNLSQTDLASAYETLGTVNGSTPVPGDIFFFWAGNPLNDQTESQIISWAAAAQDAGSAYNIHVWTEASTFEKMSTVIGPDGLTQKERLEAGGVVLHPDVEVLINPALRPYFEQAVRNGGYSIASDIARWSIIRNGGIYLDVDYGPGTVDLSQPPPVMSLNDLPIIGPSFRQQATWDGVEAMLQASNGRNPSPVEMLNARYNSGNINVSFIIAPQGAGDAPDTPAGAFFVQLDQNMLNGLQQHLQNRPRPPAPTPFERLFRRGQAAAPRPQEIGRPDLPYAAALTGPIPVINALNQVAATELGIVPLGTESAELGWGVSLLRRGGESGQNLANIAWVTPLSDDTFERQDRLNQLPRRSPLSVFRRDRSGVPSGSSRALPPPRPRPMILAPDNPARPGSPAASGGTAVPDHAEGSLPAPNCG